MGPKTRQRAVGLIKRRFYEEPTRRGKIVLLRRAFHLGCHGFEIEILEMAPLASKEEMLYILQPYALTHALDDDGWFALPGKTESREVRLYFYHQIALMSLAHRRNILLQACASHDLVESVFARKCLFALDHPSLKYIVCDNLFYPGDDEDTTEWIKAHAEPDDLQGRAPQ